MLTGTLIYSVRCVKVPECYNQRYVRETVEKRGEDVGKRPWKSMVKGSVETLGKRSEDASYIRLPTF